MIWNPQKLLDRQRGYSVTLWPLLSSPHWTANLVLVTITSQTRSQHSPSWTWRFILFADCPERWSFVFEGLTEHLQPYAAQLAVILDWMVGWQMRSHVRSSTPPFSCSFVVIATSSHRCHVCFLANRGSGRGVTRDAFWWRAVFAQSCSTDEHWGSGV